MNGNASSAIESSNTLNVSFNFFCSLNSSLKPNFFSAPLFIFQWQFDSFQLYADNVKVSTPSRHQWDYIHRVGRSLRSTFNNVTAVFSPACIAHEVLTKPNFNTIAVAGVTLPDAIDCWANSVHSKVGNRIGERGEIENFVANQERDEEFVLHR